MKHTIQGNRILVKLDEFQKTEKGGIINPLYVDGISDGGRPVSQIDEFPLAPVGTIVQISKGALKTIQDLELDIAEGDRISIQPHSMHKANYFYMNPRKKVIDITDEDERHVSISPANILSKIED